VVEVAGTAGRLVMTLALAVAASQEIPRPATADKAPPESRTADGASDAQVLEKFLNRPDEPVRSFRARRHLEITSGALGKKAWMDVLAEMDPDLGFRYTVTASGGSEMLQNRILRRVLGSEQEVYAAKANPKGALTAANYVLEPCGRCEGGLVCLAATARRKEVGLINGRFLVTADTADLVEVTGTMAKAPTFWIPRVDLMKRYARIQGHRVNVRVESVSHVRLLGASRFTMTAEYEMIDGDLIARPEITRPPDGGGKNEDVARVP